MPFSGQDYYNHGWSYTTPNINRGYAWRGFTFPGGVAVGTEKWWNTVLDQVVPLIKGGIAPGGYAMAGTWGYANRANVNSPSRPSFHAGGLALDINAPWNVNGRAPGTGQYQLPPGVDAAVRRLGGLWGGTFTGTKDAMHIECHLSRVEMTAWKPPGTTPPPAAKPPTPPAAKPPAAKPPATTPFPLPAGYYFGPLSGPNQSISGMAKNGSDAKYRPSIKRIQAVVKVPQDGLYGPASIAAVKRWQTTSRIHADGLTGRVTWVAMKL